MGHGSLKKIRVLIVDDSALIRKLIIDILRSEPLIEVVGYARNGKECVEKTLALKPDIITLDIEMPILNGIGALKELKNLKSLPIVIILSSFSTTGAKDTIKALEIGAMDFITKPKGIFLKDNINELKAELISKIKDLMKSNYIYKPEGRVFINKNIKTSQLKKSSVDYIIGIGTSTGGPKALQDVLPKLPAEIPASILVVQHMPESFTKALADRLNNISQIKVKEAANCEILKSGCAYIAPGGNHMEVIYEDGEYRVEINKKPFVNGHRPSVDVMMESMANLINIKTIAVIMTGMGSDGANGAKAVKKAGGKTIAQDEESSIVYGMPKSAIEVGAIDTILPLKDISKQILKYMGV